MFDDDDGDGDDDYYGAYARGGHTELPFLKVLPIWLFRKTMAPNARNFEMLVVVSLINP